MIDKTGHTAILTRNGGRKYWILLSIGLGTFMSALDGSVVNIILPVIRAHFGSDVATIEWTVVVYLLVVSGLMLSFGRLGDLRGHKKVYLAGFLVFIASSAMCGLSSSANMLIAFRGVQALGAAMLMANSPAILTSTFPAKQRGQALGMQSTMTYLGLMVGPSLGGWLAQYYGWQTVFYINIPVGLLALTLSAIFIYPDAIYECVEQFDLAGALLFTAGLVSVQFALNRGYEWGWSSPTLLGFLAAGAVILVVFINVEKRNNNPMLDMTLFRSRVFTAATASAVLNYVSIYSLSFLLPFYLIKGRNFSSSYAGLLLTAQPIIMAITAPISGALSDRIGSRLPATLGMAIMAIGIFMLSQLGPTTPQNYILLSLAVVGLGTGIFISPNTSALLGAAPGNRQGIAAGIMATSRTVGMVMGVGLSGAILTTLMERETMDALFNAVATGITAAMLVAIIASFTSAVRGSE